MQTVLLATFRFLASEENENHYDFHLRGDLTESLCRKDHFDIRNVLHGWRLDGGCHPKYSFKNWNFRRFRVKLLAGKY